MPSAPLPPEKQAELEDLTQAIREAVDAEIGELAAKLASTDDAHLFGENEFQIRALAHRIAAKAVEQHLARKKTMTRHRARISAPARVTSGLVCPIDGSQCPREISAMPYDWPEDTDFALWELDVLDRNCPTCGR